jgi:PAS domain S-box-containing protein
MVNVASKLFLLIAGLSQQKSKEQVIQFFVENIRTIFRSYTFTWYKAINQSVKSYLPICSPTKIFGYIEYSDELEPDHDLFALFNGSCQMLAVFLERLEQEELLNSNKKFDEMVSEQGDRFRSFVENANDIVYSLSFDGKFSYVSPKWTEILGHEVEEVEGKHFGDFVHPEDLQNCLAAFVQAAGVGDRQSGIEYRVKHKNGTWRWHTSNTTSIRNPQGEIVSLVGIARDITEHKQVELALKESEERFRITLEQTQTAIWDWDLVNNKWYASPQFYTMLGYELSEKEIDWNIWLERVHPEDLGAVSLKIEEVLSSKISGTVYETRIRHADGTYRWHCLQGYVASYNPQGMATRMLGTEVDVTQQKLAEKALQKSNRELKAISVCNQLLFRAEDEQTLLSEICQIICNEAGYGFAWVGFAENDKEKTVHPVAWAGKGNEYLINAKISWSGSSPYGQDPTGRSIREEKIYCIQDFETDPIFSPWRENVLKQGFRSSVALPLKDENSKVFGAINIYSYEPNSFTDDELRLLEGLSGDLAFGISTLRSLKKRKRAEKALAESEEKYRNLVESSMEAILIFQKWKITYANSAALTLLGAQSLVQIFGKTFFEIVHPSYHEIVRQHIEKIDSENKPTPIIREKVVQLNGNVVDVEVTSSPFTFKGRQAVQVVMRNISEQEQIERSLNESQALYSSFVEHLPASVFRKDKLGRYVFVNSLFCKIRGVSREDVIGKTADELIKYEGNINSEECSENVKALRMLDLQGSLHHEQIIQTGCSIELIEQYPQPDGTVKYYQVVKTPVTNTEGERIGSQGVQFDITERMLAEEKIKDSERLLNESQKISGIGSYTLDIVHDEWKGSVVLEEMFGIDSTYDHSVEGWLNIVHPLDREMMTTYFSAEVIGKKQRFDREYRILSKSTQQERWVHGIGELEFDAQGSPIRMIGTIQDITEKKMVEERILYHQELLSEMGQVAKIGGWEFDCITGKGTWTEEVARIHELDPLVEPNLEVGVSFYQGESKELISRAIDDAVRFGIPYNIELELITAKGNRKWVQTIGRPIIENEKVVKIRGAFQDITERKKITRELIAAKEKAEESDRLKSHFLANMSHEVRTPMNSIMGFSSLLADEEDHGLTTQYAKIIFRNSEQLMHILDDIVLYSQLQTKLLSYHPSQFETKKLFSDIFQSFDLPEFNNTGVVLLVDSDCDSEIVIHSDYEKIRQIFVNLVSNAFKYTTSGAIYIGVRIDADQLLFTVRDTGIGVPPDEREKIFERFYRSSNIDKGKIGGTGLGLSIVKELIDILDGKIWVESTVGKGSCFFFTIPQQPKSEKND